MRPLTRPLLAFTAAALLASAPCAQAVAEQKPEQTPVQVVGVHLSANGFLIDVRYRVTGDGGQALLDRKLQPALVNDATGQRYYVPNTPKLGPLRQTQRAHQPAQPGRIYFMLFANPDRKLQAGEKVSLHVGDAVVPGLVVTP